MSWTTPLKAMPHITIGKDNSKKNPVYNTILEVGQPGNFLPMMLSAPRQPRERV